MTSTTATPSLQLRIWQQNVNKSKTAQEDLINTDVHRNYDLILLQEPYLDGYGNTRATRHWRVVYPSSRLSSSDIPQSVMLVNTVLDMNRWAQLTVTDTG